MTSSSAAHRHTTAQKSKDVVSLITAAALALGGASFIWQWQHPTPAAAAPVPNGVDDSGNYPGVAVPAVDSPGGRGDITGTINVDPDALYYADPYDFGTFNMDASGTITSVAAASLPIMAEDETPLISAEPFSTIAIDAGADSNHPAIYTWYYSNDNYVSTAEYSTALTASGQSLPSGVTYTVASTQPVAEYVPGSTTARVHLVPRSATLEGSALPMGWSGGEVIQKNGQIFFSGGEGAVLQTNFRMMIYDPKTYRYLYSGQIEPASPSDNIFQVTTGGVGYVASDMALDGYGNAYIMVVGQAPVGNQWQPGNVTGVVRRQYLVRVVPGGQGTGWKYNIVAMMQSSGDASNTDSWAGTGSTGGPGDTDAWGMAFLDGKLYVATITDLFMINPMSGEVSHVPQGVGTDLGRDVRDLGSAQTAMVLAGQVFNDTEGDGAVDPATATGVANQTVALYGNKSGDNWTLLGTRQTDGSGNYSFILGGPGDYLVRLIQPQVEGYNAVQSWASAGQGSGNSVTPVCGSSTLSASGKCTAALGYIDKAAGAIGSTIIESDANTYSRVTIASSADIPAADFGITAHGSYGKSTLMPATRADGGPNFAHVAGTGNVYLGATLSGAADGSDAQPTGGDGLTYTVGGNTFPLQNGGLVANSTYVLNTTLTGQGTVSGQAVSAATGVPDPITLSGYQPTEKGDIQARFTTGSTDHPAKGSPEAETTPWMTYGEIEDYGFYVANSLVRVAAVTHNGTVSAPFTYTFTGISTQNPTSTTPDSLQPTVQDTVVASAGVHEPEAAGAVTITSSQQTGWGLTTNTKCVTAAGADVTSQLSGNTVSLNVAAGQDVLCTFDYATFPDLGKSRLSASPAGSVTANDTASFTGTATILSAADVPMATTVSFTLTSDRAGTTPVTDTNIARLSAATCTTQTADTPTQAAGTCGVQVFAKTAGTYYLHATVPQAAGTTGTLTDSPVTLTFGAGGGDPAQSSMTVNAGPLVVGTGASSTYTAQVSVKDSSGNATDGSVVTFTIDEASGGQPLISNNGTCATVNGTCSVTITSTDDGVFTLHATLPDLTTGAPTDLTTGSPAILRWNPGPISPQTSTFVVSPASTGINTQATATLTLADSHGNRITDLTEAEAAFDAGGATVATGFTAQGNGVYTWIVTSSTAGTYDLSVNPRGTGAKRVSVSFQTGAPDPANSTVVVNPASQQVGLDISVTVTVRDAGNNPLANYVASDFDVTASRTSGTFDAVIDNFRNNQDGTYTFDLTSRLVSAYTLTAEVVGIDVGEHPAVNFYNGGVCVSGCTPVDANNVTRVAMDVNQQLADGQSQDTAVLWAYDTYGNPVPGATFQAVAATGSEALTPQRNTGSTGPTGQGSLAWTSATPGTFTAAVDFCSAPNTCDLRPVTGVLSNIIFETSGTNATNSTLTITPATQPIKVGQSYTLLANVKDDQNHTLGGITVNFTAAAPASLSQSSCVTLASTGSCSVTVTAQQVGTYVVTASVSVSGTQTQITGSPARVAFEADAICIPGVDVCDPVKFTHVEVTRDSQPADGVATDEATVFTYDRFGNPVAGVPVSTTTDDTELLIVTGTGTSAALSGTDAGTAKLTYASNHAAPHLAKVFVTAANIELTGSGGSPITLNFRSGNADANQSRLSVSPAGPIPVEGVYTITATVLDPTGNNPVAGQGVVFTGPAEVTFVGGVSTCTSATTTGTCSVQVTSTTAGAFQVAATMDGAGLGNSPVNVQWTPGTLCIEDPSTPALECHPTNRTRVEVMVNGQLPDNTARDIARVWAYDKYGNAIPNLPVTSTAITAGLALQPNISPTSAQGISDIWYTAGAGGFYLADVSVGGLVPTGSPIRLGFGSGIGASGNFSIMPSGPLTVGTGAGSTYTLTAEVFDALGAPAPGEVVTFALDSSGPTWIDQDGDGTADSSCVTDTNGTCTAQLYSTRSGTYGISARIVAAQLGTAISRVWLPDEVCVDDPATTGVVECTPEPGVPNEARTRVVINPNGQVADGETPDVANVYAFDKWGNAVEGALVESTATDPNVLTVRSGIPGINAQGVSRVEYVSLTAGDHTAQVRVQGKVIPNGGNPATLTFVPGSVCIDDPATAVVECTPDPGVPNSQRTRVELTKDGAVVGGTDYDRVTVFAFDQHGNPVPGATITTTPATADTNGDGLNDLTPARTSANTNDSGATTFDFRSLVATAQQARFFVMVAGSPIEIKFVPQPSPPAAAVTPPAQVTAYSSPVTMRFVAAGFCPPDDPQCAPEPWVPNDRRSRIEITTNNQVADGQAADVVRAYLFDRYGNPLSGMTVVTDPAQADANNDGINDLIAQTAAVAPTNASGTTSIGYMSLVADTHSASVSVMVNGTAHEIVFTPQPQPPATGPAPAIMQSSPANLTFVPMEICIDDPNTEVVECAPNPEVPNDRRTRIDVTVNNRLANGTSADVVRVSAFDRNGNPVGQAGVTTTPDSADTNGDGINDLVAQAVINPTSVQGTTTIGYTSLVSGDHQAKIFLITAAGPVEVGFVPQPASIAGMTQTEIAEFIDAHSSPATLTFVPDGPCIDDPATPDVVECTPEPWVPNERRTRLEIATNNAVADGVDHDVVMAYVFDRRGNPVPNITVTQQALSTDLTVQGAIDPTGAQGYTRIGYTSMLAAEQLARVFIQVNGAAVEIAFIPQPSPPAAAVTPPEQVAAYSSPAHLKFVPGSVCVDDPATETVECVPEPWVPDDRRSRVEVYPDGQPADGVSQNVANAYLFDRYGNAVPGIEIRSTAVTEGLVVGPVVEVTPDEDGTMVEALPSASEEASRNLSSTEASETEPAPTVQIAAPAGPQLTDNEGLAQVGYSTVIAGVHSADVVFCITDAAGATVCRPVIFTPQPAEAAQGARSAAPLAQSSPITMTFMDPDPIGIEILRSSLFIEETQDIAGLEFEPGETVTGQIHFGEDLVWDLGTAVADANGRADFDEFPMPVDAPIGTHTVTLTGEISGEVSGTYIVKQVVIETGLPIPPAQGYLGGLGIGMLGAAALVMVGWWRRRFDEEPEMVR